MQHFLIIDDIALIRMVTKKMILKHYPDAVFGEAENELQAMQLLQKEHFDIIILDLNMPNSKPTPIIDYAKEHKQDASIIILTSVDVGYGTMDYYQMGVKGYVHKSRQAVELINAIKTVLAGGIFKSEVLVSFLEQTQFFRPVYYPRGKTKNE
jgi:DNA-binding NarL/FixJ family response regulator